MATPFTLSLVVPVFNEVDGIDAFYERTARALDALPGCTSEMVFVDDGSSDGSYQRLAAFHARDPRVRVVKLSRNFGHQVAISAGIDVADSDCTVVIDADLQDPPEVMADMVTKWREGYDVVYGLRTDRAGESALKLWTAALFYRLLKRVAKIDVPVDVGDFRLMSRRVTEELKQLREKDRFVRGLVSWIGYPQTGVPYRRDKRYAGETKYPYTKMIKFAFDGITSFSTVPLKLATWLGYAASALAFTYMLSVFVQKWMGITVQGWATVMVAMLFLGGVQLICLGIVGEYLGRIFTELKPRPMYVVAEMLERTSQSPPDAATGRRR